MTYGHLHWFHGNKEKNEYDWIEFLEESRRLWKQHLRLVALAWQVQDTQDSTRYRTNQYKYAQIPRQKSSIAIVLKAIEKCCNRIASQGHLEKWQDHFLLEMLWWASGCAPLCPSGTTRNISNLHGQGRWCLGWKQPPSRHRPTKSLHATQRPSPNKHTESQKTNREETCNKQSPSNHYRYAMHLSHSLK